MTTVNIPKNVPKLAWVIISIGLCILMGCIGYSFIKGYSYIQRTAEKAEELTKEMDAISNEIRMGAMRQELAPGTPVFIKHTSAGDVEVRKGGHHE